MDLHVASEGEGLRRVRLQNATVNLTSSSAGEIATLSFSATHKGPHTQNLSLGFASRGDSSQAAGARLAEARRAAGGACELEASL